jgi:hypothetical protein
VHKPAESLMDINQVQLAFAVLSASSAVLFAFLSLDANQNRYLPKINIMAAAFMTMYYFYLAVSKD